MHREIVNSVAGMVHHEIMYLLDVVTPGNSCTDTGTKSTTNIQTTPIIAEKPFIVFEEAKYYLAIPKLRTNAVGPSNYGTDFDKESFEKVFVAR